MTLLNVHFRLARAPEAPDVQRFFEKYQDRHVMPRGEEAYRLTAEGQTLFVAEVRPPHGTLEWGGISGVYHLEKDGLVLKEAGGSRVAPQYEGLGIHKVFHALRSVTIGVFDPSYDAYFGAIIAPNARSEHNLRATGFAKWENPPATLTKERLPYAGPGETIEYFRLDDQEFPKMAQRLLDYLDTARILRKDNAGSIVETCRVTFDVPVLRGGMVDAVKDIAAGNYASGY